MAFYRVEPWGSAIDDERAGTVAATVFNYGGMVVPKMARLPEDFFPRIKPPPKPQTISELADVLKRATLAAGGKVE